MNGHGIDETSALIEKKDLVLAADGIARHIGLVPFFRFVEENDLVFFRSQRDRRKLRLHGLVHIVAHIILRKIHRASGVVIELDPVGGHVVVVQDTAFIGVDDLRDAKPLRHGQGFQILIIAEVVVRISGRCVFGQRPVRKNGIILFRTGVGKGVDLRAVLMRDGKAFAVFGQFERRMDDLARSLRAPVFAGRFRLTVLGVLIRFALLRFLLRLALLRLLCGGPVRIDQDLPARLQDTVRQGEEKRFVRVVRYIIILQRDVGLSVVRDLQPVGIGTVFIAQICRISRHDLRDGKIRIGYGAFFPAAAGHKKSHTQDKARQDRSLFQRHHCALRQIFSSVKWYAKYSAKRT